MAKRLNLVHNDEIWKDHVRREQFSFTKKWPEKWGYLRDEYHTMNSELSGTPRAHTPPSQTKLPAIREKVALVENREPFPETSSSLIGWKSTNPAWRLEKYGRYAPNARGQIGICKLFNWPQQAI